MQVFVKPKATQQITGQRDLFKNDRFNQKAKNKFDYFWFEAHFSFSFSLRWAQGQQTVKATRDRILHDRAERGNGFMQTCAKNIDACLSIKSEFIYPSS